jgi:hypothetical protein
VRERNGMGGGFYRERRATGGALGGGVGQRGSEGMRHRGGAMVTSGWWR